MSRAFELNAADAPRTFEEEKVGPWEEMMRNYDVFVAKVHLFSGLLHLMP